MTIPCASQSSLEAAGTGDDGGAARNRQRHPVPIQRCPSRCAAMAATIMLLGMPVAATVVVSAGKTFVDDWLSPVGRAGQTGAAMSRVAAELQRTVLLVSGPDRHWGR